MVEPKLSSESRKYRTQTVHCHLLLNRNLSFLQKQLSHGTIGGKRGRSWLRHCVTSRKVAGSILDGEIAILN